MSERLPSDDDLEPSPAPIWPLLLAACALLFVLTASGAVLLVVLFVPQPASPRPTTVVVNTAPRTFVDTPVPTRSVPLPPVEETTPPPPDDRGNMLVRLKELPPVTTDNGNKLIQTHRPNLTMTASSVWPGWPADKVTDDQIETSWFSARDDAAALKKTPWVQANFPVDVAVRRVTILGNREPAWLIGFTILSGRVTLYDKDDREITKVQNDGTGNFRDFDFKFDPPIEGVRGVRFTSLKDQGDQTVYKDIAIAELQVE